MDGILNVCKEPGYTSFDVVAKLRGICNQKKIGHTGTLDPDASGVLVVCLGKATKLCDMLTGQDKEYRAVMLLGCTTDTQDITGRILTECPVVAEEEQVRQAVLSFVGEYDQLPPMYSALKVNGKKLCDLARAGKEVERSARRIAVSSITIEEIRLPRVTMTVSCSKGTYIRTLCHDIGQRLGCGAVMESLVRTRSGQFRIADAHCLADIEKLAKCGALSKILIPTDAVFEGLNAAMVLPEARCFADNGNPLFLKHLCAADGKGTTKHGPCTEGEQIRVYGEDGRFYGIYVWQERLQRFKPLKLFLQEGNSCKSFPEQVNLN